MVKRSTPPRAISGLVNAFSSARLLECYGSTETGTITGLDHPYVETHSHTVGLAGAIAELRLVDLRPDGAGELCARHQAAPTSYWNLPAESSATFRQGWIRTGDIARIDADGFVEILDRVKDMIIRGGANVYCVEVEAALVQHPAVLEAAVIGVPDTVMGEAVGAVVRLAPGASTSESELREFASGLIADYKVPDQIQVANTPFARNANGKLDKRDIRRSTRWEPRPTRPQPCPDRVPSGPGSITV